MAICLYSNGITESYKPSNLIFTEEELLHLFPEYKEVKTCRVVSLINTWCIYGNGNDPSEFNRIASDIINESVYSHILFVHDSELNANWNVTDNIIYKGYEEFFEYMKKIIDTVAMNILHELEMKTNFENKADFLPQLIALGSTDDKRIVFGFNPDDQTNDFYTNEEFYKFSQKVYDFLSINKQEKEPFTIYADKKAIIIVESVKVKKFLTTLLEKFKSREDYEICTDITKIINNWTKITKKPVVKKTRKISPKSNNETNNT